MRRSIVILALGAFCTSASAASPPPPVLIRADKIYTAPDAQPLLHGTVLLSGGQISAVADQHSRLRVPPGTRSSDCQGVVVAGFQNSHVHFTERKFENAAHAPAEQLERDLRAMTSRYGFTSVFDTASDEQNTVALRARVERGDIRGPRIRTVGWGIFPPKGVPFYISDLPKHVLARLPQPEAAAQARAVVRSNLDGGANATKIFMVTSPGHGVFVTLPPEVARAAGYEHFVFDTRNTKANTTYHATPGFADDPFYGPGAYGGYGRAGFGLGTGFGRGFGYGGGFGYGSGLGYPYDPSVDIVTRTNYEAYAEIVLLTPNQAANETRALKASDVIQHLMPPANLAGQGRKAT